MSTVARHFKFINSKTGYVLHYYSVNMPITEDELKAELEKIKDQVATNNKVYCGTIYWEEIKDDE
ncbi:hypothetical protein FFF34_017745 [Inquilinus sp. KBS0705]|nr:hypothetical protein FFF34_017745 [Inquilinus sp. KBS0705]